MFELTHWHWFILMVVIGVIEMMSLSMYLIGPAIAAGLVGLVKLIYPELSLFASLMLFSFLTVAMTYLARFFLKNTKEGEQELGLEANGSEYIGRTFALESDVVNGTGRVKVGDGAWNARGPDASAGSKIRITGVQGNALLYELAD